MIGLIRKLLKDRRGNILAITAAALPLVVGAAGLATDTIQWTLWRRQLQRAADSAAFAGVYDRSAATNGATTNTPSAVCRDLAINLHTWMSLIGTSPCTGSVGSYSTLTYPSNTAFVTNQVSVTLRVQQPLPFSSLFMSAAPVITASATAGTVSAGTPCALALNTSGTALDNGGNTTINAPNCILYSNSTSSNSASAGGSSSVTAKAVAAVGGIQSSNNWHVQQYIPYSPSVSDPFASITPDPTDMRCAVTSTTKKGVTTYTPVGISDGDTFSSMKDSSGNQANCFTSLSVGSNKSLSIPDTYTGPIYINGGNVDLQGAFSCAACTIVLTNSDPTSTTIGTFSTNAQATNNITAPTTGTYKGIAIYQDRRATGNTDTVNGGSGSVIRGAVYFPSDTLRINGTGLLDASGNSVNLCAMWVAKNLTFLGNSSIGLSSPDDSVCASVGFPTGSAAKMVRLIS
jgi:hypothetical protein